jgi:predicted 3-demethylubiquinone-9 3-methyltransferase (glyoxalase superfamily)
VLTDKHSVLGVDERCPHGGMAFAAALALKPGGAADMVTTSGPAGSVKTAAFTLGDQRYRAIEAGPLDPFNHSFSIIVECDDQAEIDRLWDALKQGGAVEQCGWLRDRWGLSWQITPRRLGELGQGEGSGFGLVCAPGCLLATMVFRVIRRTEVARR